VITLAHVYLLIGALLIGAAGLNLRDRRWAMAAFWAVLAVPFVVGDSITAATRAGTRWPAQAMGGGVVALAVLASVAGLGRARVAPDDGHGAAPGASAARLGNWLFVPALAIPAVTLAIVLAARYLPAVAAALEPGQATLIALGIAATLALGVALAVTRSHPRHAVTEGRRLLDAIGWAAALPMLLAALGVVFDQTGVGRAIAALVTAVIPIDSRLACLVAYGLGMVVFTMIMGNAFAAFPVMTAGIGLPLVVVHHHGDPAALGAIGMLTGYCGTLLTPMAANFNIVPTILLELRDQYSVIRAQWPTALALMVTNLVVMDLAVFR
jgi:uncharacterized membrane protein